MATKRGTAKAPPDIDALVSAAEVTLANEGFVKLTALGPAAVRATVAARLRDAGYEVTSKVVRVPLEQQLEKPLRDGGFVPVKQLGAHVVGATAAEAQRAADALVRSGKAQRVLRTTVETLVPRQVPVLSRTELVEAAKRLTALAKLLTTASKKKKPTSLLSDDVRAELQRVLPTTSVDRVLRAVDQAREGSGALSFVPKVVQLLGPDLDAAAAQRALLDAAQKGLLELRPEGGLGRLSEADLRVCPEGPQGTRLSWARRLDRVDGRGADT